jgi:penicillin amidase
MAPADRAWLDAFVEGLNWQQTHAARLPPDFGLMGLDREPFSAEDVVAIGRLAGADVNWLVLGALLRGRDRPDFGRVWKLTLESGVSLPSFRPGAVPEAALLLEASRSGSNSVVISPARSTTGAALVANDPHLGFALPNFWVLAGMSAPSYRAVGFMIPGVPLVTVGRTERLAWGGTNMRGASSDLVDVTGRADAGLTAGQVTIRTRLWRDATRTVRSSRYGPIVSDIPFLGARPGELLALRWTGHDPSDEIGAFLRVLRARNVDEFRRAFAGHAVPAQNMLAADADGNIAHVLAARLPRRTWRTPAGPVVSAADADAGWASFADATELPWARSPPAGFLVSANNRPASESEVPLGWFFAAEERVARLKALVTAKPRLGPEDLMALQHDVVSTHARDLARVLVALVDEAPGLAARGPAALAALRGWDGAYAADERAPVAFEILLHRLVPAVYGVKNPRALPPHLGHLWSWNLIVHGLPDDLAALGPETRAAAMGDALAAAERGLVRFPTWGAMHRLEVAGVLARAPVVGRAFKYESIPSGGSRETVMKSAHGLVNGKHAAFYGSQARHVSDLSDADANWFVLMGGQDGWPGSDTFRDQVELWKRGGPGGYVRMPLRPETVAAEFPHSVDLTPRHRV